MPDQTEAFYAINPSLPRTNSYDGRRHIFMIEAYNILAQIQMLNSNLFKSRRQYLGIGIRNRQSPAQTTDMDSHSNSLIKVILERIQILQHRATAMDKDVPEKSLMETIMASADPSTDPDILHAQTLKIHRKSVLWLLEDRLMKVSNLQKQMQEKRLEQTLKQQEGYLLNKLPNQQPAAKVPSMPNKKSQTSIGDFASTIIAATSIDTSADGWDVDFDSILQNTRKTSPTEAEAPVMARELQLTPVEISMLELENETIFSTLQSTLDQVRTATQNIQEISYLQTRLAQHLSAQQSEIDRIYEESYRSVGLIEDSNIHLLKAEKNFGGARKMVIVFLLVASFCLLFLDWFYS